MPSTGLPLSAAILLAMDSVSYKGTDSRAYQARAEGQRSGPPPTHDPLYDRRQKRLARGNHGADDESRAILYCGTMPSSPTVAQVSGKRAPFIIFESNTKLACVGDAAIRGSNNELTNTGQCSSLDLAGSNNKIEVTSDFGKVATVNISGSVNAIF